jgi:hypothetical protein
MLIARTALRDKVIIHLSFFKCENIAFILFAFSYLTLSKNPFYSLYYKSQS